MLARPRGPRGHGRVRRRRRVDEQASHVAQAHGVGDGADPFEHAPAGIQRGLPPAPAPAARTSSSAPCACICRVRQRVAGVVGSDGWCTTADGRVGGEARGEDGGGGALLPLAQREGAQAARDEEGGEGRDDAAEALDDEVADARRRARDRRTRSRRWRRRARRAPWSSSARSRSTPRARGVCAKGVAKVLSATVARPRGPRQGDDGRDVGDGEVGVGGRLDVEDARAGTERGLVGARRGGVDERGLDPEAREALAQRGARSRRTWIAERRRGRPARRAPASCRSPRPSRWRWRTRPGVPSSAASFSSSASTVGFAQRP